MVLVLLASVGCAGKDSQGDGGSLTDGLDDAREAAVADVPTSPDGRSDAFDGTPDGPEVEQVACAPEGPACCSDDVCEHDCANEPGTPYTAADGTCVECLNDDDCPVAFPTCANHRCVNGCPPWAPFPVNGHCFECTNDSHCECGSCQADGRCWFGYGNCACVEPYAACITYEGQIMCVECVSDGDCPLGCGCGANYACVEPDGDVCPRLSAGCAHDCLTAGCPDPEHVWSTLACDPAAGCCASSDARCDDRMAFCTQAGSVCVALRDIFGLTAAVSLDGLEACNGFASGYCTCDPTTQATCATTPPGTIGGCCPAGQTCIAGDELFRRLVGDPTAAPPVDASAWSFCVLDDGRL